jgi:hypothetical protein
MVLGDAVGPERVQGPVLEEQVTLRPMAAAPAVNTAAAVSLSSVPENSTTDSVSFWSLIAPPSFSERRSLRVERLGPIGPLWAGRWPSDDGTYGP